MQNLRTDMQIIFQDPYASLNPRMTVSETIGQPMMVNKICRKKSEVEKRVAELMDTVGLASRLYNAYPHELDGGRRQRIGIARALSLNPKFIVCDEPVSALDVSIQAQILNLLMDLQKEFGLSMIFIAHNLATVQYISQRIIVMYLGHVVEIADADVLYENPCHPYTQALIASIPMPDPEMRKEAKGIEGEIPSPINPPSGCVFRTRCPYASETCAGNVPVLKEKEPGHFVACDYINRFGGNE